MNELSMPPLPKRVDQPPRAQPRPPAKPKPAAKPGPRLDPGLDPRTIGRQDSVDWDALRRAAMEAAQQAYAPYSRLQVGAAGLTEHGHVVVGCNVENASYGLSLCAECGMVSALVASGGGRLVAMSTVAAHADRPDRFGHISPCGRCRQVLIEHGGAECLIDGPEGARHLGDLLPDAFLPENLP